MLERKPTAGGRRSHLICLCLGKIVLFVFSWSLHSFCFQISMQRVGIKFPSCLLSIRIREVMQLLIKGGSSQWCCCSVAFGKYDTSLSVSFVCMTTYYSTHAERVNSFYTEKVSHDPKRWKEIRFGWSFVSDKKMKEFHREFRNHNSFERGGEKAPLRFQKWLLQTFVKDSYHLSGSESF